MRRMILALLTGALFVAGAGAAEPQPQEDVFTVTVGDVKVHLLAERQGTGDAPLLIGATDAMLREFTDGGTFKNAINAWLIQPPGGDAILVDTGFGTKLFDNLAKFGLKAGDIKTILVTHMHGDHIGGLVRDGEKTFPNATVYLPQDEVKYWSDNAIKDAQPQQKRAGFEAAQRMLEIYRGQTELFAPDEKDALRNRMFGVVYPVKAYGHTPGHTAFLVDSAGQRLLIWGDLTHAMSIQMPVPEVALVYDVDPQQAVQTRREMLEFVVRNKIPVAGMHIAYPATGTVEKATYTLEQKQIDGYRFTPASR